MYGVRRAGAQRPDSSFRDAVVGESSNGPANGLVPVPSNPNPDGSLFTDLVSLLLILFLLILRTLEVEQDKLRAIHKCFFSYLTISNLAYYHYD